MGQSIDQEQTSIGVAEAAREKDWQYRSFVAELFMGHASLPLVFPFPEQSEDDARAGDDVLAKLREFLRQQVDPDQIDRDRTIPQSVIDGLADLGLFGIKLPLEFGGLGLSQTNYNRIIQLVASHCSSTAVMLSAHQSIGVPQPLKLFGTEDQKARYLPRLAKGAISAFALTEPGVGSDPSSIATTAVEQDDGSWLLNGEKLWITNGPIAEVLVVMARSNAPEEDPPEITAFIVEGDSDGLTRAHRCDFMGLKGVQNGLLHFTDVRVPADNIIIGRGEGLRLALRTLNIGRLTLPAACGGLLKQAVEMARDWAGKREQWGAPVGRHEAVGQHLAAMAADTLAVESITWLTSALADRGEVDIRLEAAMAKLWCTEALWRGVDSLVQVRGGRGYETADSLRSRGETPMPAERMLRDARINLIIEGTSEIMRLFIAREALDPHLKAAGATATGGKPNFFKAAKFYARWYPALWVPGVGHLPGLPGLLAGHLRYLNRGAKRLARDLFHRIVFYREALQKKQAILGRLVDIGAELFAMAAVLSYVSSRQGPAQTEQLADLFCRQARRRIEHLRRSLRSNDDQFAFDRAQDLLDGNCSWLQDNILSTWKDA